MRFRSRVGKSKSRRSFRRASGTNVRNVKTPSMRGGIRM
ncbi:MAG: hypothetical protein [Microvirus sp.]|nr:MAG: hypothetical protein [Microvirus sp.]